MNAFLNTADAQTRDNLFFSQGDKIALEAPDLKIIQDNTVSSIAVPSVVTTQVLGDVFGTAESLRKEITDYTVQSGDTVQSVANLHNISAETVAWANEISTSTKLKVGQNLVVLPVDGVLHVVKTGDTVAAIASKYKAKADSIVSFNNLTNQSDIYIGDILVVPGGVLPKNTTPAISTQVPVAGNYYIFPATGRITQGLHYFNAIDLANVCGTPIHAAAAGTVQRAVGNGGYNQGMGNHVTILHSNGTVTYYGHLQTVLVNPGDRVDVGQVIGLMGRTGNATGCHVHFQVVGAANPLARYYVGSYISYGK